MARNDPAQVVARAGAELAMLGRRVWYVQGARVMNPGNF